MNELPKPEKAGPRSRYVFIDALRGVAALWVVFVHAYTGKHLTELLPYLPGPLRLFLSYGWLGVPIFFVISGFVIAHSIGNDRVTFGYFGRFVVRRSLRLDPPYWASMVLVIGMAVLSSLVIPNKELLLPTWGDILAHLFYMQDILKFHQINDVYWTLCVEIQFYLIYCALLGIAQLFRKSPTDTRSLLWIFGPAAALSLLWAFHIAPITVNRGLFVYLWYGFLLGVYANWAFLGKISSWIFYLYAALVLIAGVLYADAFPITCVIVSVMLREVGRAGKLKVWLDWRWLQFLGLLSYSLYLIHNPITGAAFNVGFRLTGRTPLTEAVWFVVVVLINVGAAAIFWYLVERLSIQLSHRFKLKPAPVVPAEPTPSSPVEATAPELITPKPSFGQPSG